MPTVKEEVKEMLDRLPEDASVEDIQYALYVRERVARGRREAAEGKVIPHEEVMRMLDKWREK
jgi:predicted transcriptional regulator